MAATRTAIPTYKVFILTYKISHRIEKDLQAHNINKYIQYTHFTSNIHRFHGEGTKTKAKRINVYLENIEENKSREGSREEIIRKQGVMWKGNRMKLKEKETREGKFRRKKKIEPFHLSYSPKGKTRIHNKIYYEINKTITIIIKSKKLLVIIFYQVKVEKAEG